MATSSAWDLRGAASDAGSSSLETLLSKLEHSLQQLRPAWSPSQPNIPSRQPTLFDTPASVGGFSSGTGGLSGSSAGRHAAQEPIARSVGSSHTPAGKLEVPRTPGHGDVLVPASSKPLRLPVSSVSADALAAAQQAALQRDQALDRRALALRETEDELAAAKNNLEIRETELALAQDRLREQAAAIPRLRQEAEAELRAAQETRAEAKTLEGQVAEQRARLLQEADAHQAKMQTELAALADARASLEREKHSSIEEWERLRAAEAQAADQRVRLEQSAADVKARELAVVRQQAQLRSRDAALREKEAAADEQSRRAEEQLQAANAKVDALGRQLAERQQEFAAVHRSLLELRNQLQDEKTRRASLLSAMRDAGSGVDRGLLDSILKQEQDAAQGRIRQLEEQTAQQQRQIQQLQKRLAEVTSPEHTSNVRQLSEAQAELRRQAQQLASYVAVAKRQSDATDLRNSELEAKERRLQESARTLQNSHELLLAAQKAQGARERELEREQEELRVKADRLRRLEEQFSSLAAAAEQLRKREAALRAAERSLDERLAQSK